MKIPSWNVRGLSTPNKRRLVKHCMSRIMADVFLFQETKISSKNGGIFLKERKIWKGLFLDAQGHLGSLGVLWNQDRVDMSWIDSLSSWMFCKLVFKMEDLDFIFFNVYGPIKT